MLGEHKPSLLVVPELYNYKYIYISIKFTSYPLPGFPLLSLRINVFPTETR